MGQWASILFALLFATSAFAGETDDIRARISQASCEQFLTEVAPPQPITELPPPTPSLLNTIKRLFRWELEAISLYISQWRNHRAYQRKVRVYDKYIRSLANARVEAIEAWEKYMKTVLSNQALEEVYRPLASELNTKANQLFAGVVTEEQLAGANKYIRGEGGLIAGLSKTLRNKKNAAVRRIERIYETLRWTRYADDVAPIQTEAKQEIRAAQSVDQVDAILDEVLPRLKSYTDAHEVNERERPRIELRFDYRERSTSGPMLEALVNLMADNSGSIDNDFYRVNGVLSKSKEARQFVSSELQLLRRLMQLSRRQTEPEIRAKIEEGIHRRYVNDVVALRQAIADGNSPTNSFQTLQLIRQSLGVLNHPALFEQIIDRSALKRMNLFERELIAMDAMGSEELRAAIVMAATDLVRTVPFTGAPEAPTEKPPRKPNIPSTVSSQEEYDAVAARVKEYNRAVNRINKARAAHKLAMEKFWAQYQEKVAALNSAHIRRMKARQAYLAYLGLIQPNVFANTSIPHVVSERNRAWVNSHMMDPIRTEQYEHLRTRAEAAGTLPSSPNAMNSMEWYMYYYALNPTWIDNRGEAKRTVVMDYDHFSSTRPTDQSVVRESFGVPHSTRQSEPVLREVPNFGPAFRTGGGLAHAGFVTGGTLEDGPLPSSLGFAEEAPTMTPEMRGVHSELSGLPHPGGVVFGSGLLGLLDLNIPQPEMMEMPNVELSRFEQLDFKPPAITPTETYGGSGISWGEFGGSKKSDSYGGGGHKSEESSGWNWSNPSSGSGSSWDSGGKTNSGDGGWKGGSGNDGGGWKSGGSNDGGWKSSGGGDGGWKD